MDSKIADQIHDYVETSAPPIPLRSVTDRPATASRFGRRAFGPGLVTPRRVTAVAAAAVVVAAAAAIGAEEAGTSPSRGTHQPVLLTAAMLHHVEAASEAATARVGRIFVTDRSPNFSGSTDFTFSGQNYNAVQHLPKTPAGPGLTLIIRRVNGQLYILYPGRRQWVRLGNVPKFRRLGTDPRKVLAALQPAAGFKDIGSQLVDGVQTRILKASKLTKLPSGVLSSLTFFSSFGPEKLAAFEVWVDTHDVVRQIKIIYVLSSKDVNSETIRFLDIGKPEQITAPAHYVRERTSR